MPDARQNPIAILVNSPASPKPDYSTGDQSAGNLSEYYPAQPLTLSWKL
jgi:hypothetical protein